MVPEQTGIGAQRGESPDNTRRLLEARAVDIRYGDFVAVQGVDLSIASGQRVALVGESGSGKTTLAMAVAGMLTDPSAVVEAERLEFGGTPVVQPSTPLPTAVPGISMVFQDAMTSLDPTWRIGGQLVAVLRNRCKISKNEARREALSWLKRVGFSDPQRVFRMRPYELSGGMRQRVMIAIAVCSRPRLIVADEPTSALDATLARVTMDLLVELTEDAGSSLLVVTHDLKLCLEYTDKVCVMRNGRVVEAGESRRIALGAAHPYTRGLLACIPTLDSADLDFLPTLDSETGISEITPASAHQSASRDLLQGVSL